MESSVSILIAQESSQISAFFAFVTTHWQFCLLHFLEFAVWGSWIVVLGNMLNARGFSRKEIGRIYGTMPIGTMMTILFIGAIADKYMNTEVLIGISHLVGAVLLLMMAKAKNARPFYWFAFFYALAFAPTLGLVNSIVFAHDEDVFAGAAGEIFPWIRVFGTLGWIVAGLSHALILKKGEPVNENPLLLACGLSVVLGLFAFTLPETRPGAATETVAVDQNPASSDDPTADSTEAADSTGAVGDKPDDGGIIAGSIEMLKAHPVFFGVAFIAAMAMGLYFAFAALFLEKTGVASNIVGPVMTIGQWIEIFFMLTLPWFLDQLGMEWVLLIGVGAWAVRFGLFTFGKPLPLVLFGIAIHGICFDFFFAAGFIHVDSIAPKHLTATAQALLGFLVYGLGMYLGSELSGMWNQSLSKTESAADGKDEQTLTNWRAFWGIPCVIMIVATLMFLMSILSARG